MGRPTLAHAKNGPARLAFKSGHKNIVRPVLREGWRAQNGLAGLNNNKIIVFFFKKGPARVRFQANPF